jgi:tRNA pseudouridine55 synthase
VTQRDASSPGSSGQAVSGLVVVDKPAAITSHDVVARVRRLAGTRKVGHAGTLDPMATGVLVLGVNRATRLLGHLTLTDKQYAATVQLGTTTSTDDAEGEPVATRPFDGLAETDVRTALAAFAGPIDQVPSAVSAVKVAGKRSYARVRDGEQVDLPSRRVTIHELAVTSLDLAHGTVDVEVRCSSGTYVRAIARDLGEALGVGGHLTALRRTAVGPFGIDAAHTLDALAEELTMIPIAEAARACFPALDLSAGDAAHVRVGRALDASLAELTALFSPGGEFLALYEPRDDGAHAVAVFV